VLVYHAAMSKTVVYGEITASTITAKVGDKLKQSQTIGVAGACCLLHVELYNGQVNATSSWLPFNHTKSYDPDGCTHNSMPSKPKALLDPRRLIGCLKPAGASLLQDGGVAGEVGIVPKKKAAVGGATGISGGIIAAIVVVGLVLIAGIALCVVCVVRQQQRRRDVADGLTDGRGGSTAVHVANPAFASDAAVAAVGNPDANVGSASGRSGTMMAAMPPAVAPVVSGGDASRSFTISEGTMLRRGGAGFGGSSFDTIGTTAVEAVGEFKCAQCGSVYQYESDLATHTQTRHA